MCHSVHVSIPDILDEEKLKALMDTQRMLVFRYLRERYCLECGRIQPTEGMRCQCCNDE
jgi:hypothetical protein